MRRSHRKSRTGCSECKVRRIKCDEARPQCSNCTARSYQCSLSIITPTSPFPMPIQANIARPAPVTTARYQIPPAIEATSQASGLALEELELLHHYTADTCLSLANGERHVAAWRRTMPRLALQLPCLMHAVLALSALHLASLQPDRRQHWVERAATHEALALPQFRCAISKLDEDTSHAIFAFSGFVIPYTQASTLVLGSEDSARDTQECILPQWFLLLRRTGALIVQTWQWLQAGPLSLLLERTKHDIDFTRNPNDHQLSALIPMLSDSLLTSATQPDLAPCLQALEQLRRLYSLLFSPCEVVVDRSAALIWPITVSSEYVQLVQEKVPEAMVVLAYYCPLLKRAESAWYMRQQADRLFEAVKMNLDESWSLWLEWPQWHVGAI